MMQYTLFGHQIKSIVSAERCVYCLNDYTKAFSQSSSWRKYINAAAFEKRRWRSRNCEKCVLQQTAEIRTHNDIKTTWCNDVHIPQSLFNITWNHLRFFRIYAWHPSRKTYGILFTIYRQYNTNCISKKEIYRQHMLDIVMTQSENGMLLNKK